MSGDRYLGDSDTNRCENRRGVDLSSGQSFFPFGGDIFRPKKGKGAGFGTSKKSFDREYIENGKSKRYMSTRA